MYSYIIKINKYKAYSIYSLKKNKLKELNNYLFFNEKKISF